MQLPTLVQHVTRVRNTGCDVLPEEAMAYGLRQLTRLYKYVTFAAT